MALDGMLVLVTVLVLVLVYFVHQNLKEAEYMLKDLQMQWQRYNNTLLEANNVKKQINECFGHIEDRINHGPAFEERWVEKQVIKCSKL